ncbi:hypothetical protein QUF55_04600 [Clostridiaceae bacterium HSG29]|nr:hypothetical protein [Clostridiaceae bacterium HSG29]
MKKYIAILFIIIILFFVNFNNSKELLIIKDEGSISLFHINGIKYNDEAEVNDIINILKKYNTEKTKNPFPMKTDDVAFEIDYTDNHKPRHIVLGKINIIYESGNKTIYKIINGDKLYFEIEEYLNKK